MEVDVHGICEEVLKNKNINEFTIESIILTGSMVHCKCHKKSDVDLFVVVEENLEFIRHVSFKKGERLIQVRVCSFNKFLKDCMTHERRRPAAYACKILYERGGRCRKAIEDSEIFLKKGPKKISEKELVKMTHIIKNELSTIRGLIHSNKVIPATLLINQVIMMIIDYYNGVNGYWISNNNYLFDELKEHNSEMFFQIKNIILSNDLKKKSNDLQILCSMAIENFDNISGEYIYEEKV